MHKLLIPLLTIILSTSLHSEVLMSPTSVSKDLYPNNILDGNYLPSVPKPMEFLGFNLGERIATPAQISSAILRWSTASDRLKVIEYAKTHEGRPLYSVFISSPNNINDLDTIKENIEMLSDAREINDRQAQVIIKNIPAVAWMAYSIHGNETSGADAALGLIYHLIASEDPDVINLLENMVVIVDPMMNPDGRDRFAKSLDQYRGTAPNYDDQSLLHTGDWPYGRTNHYYFDLNRDWFYLTQPETQGRVALINQWRPQILVDGHEMGPQDTFMTGPPREPINKNIDPNLIKWGNKFANDQASAFDKRNWRFYTGEWHEDLYPGYSFYVQFRGSLGILYEQSRMAEDGVRRPEGTIQSYKESVHHQFISSIANLKTLQVNSKEMYQDYWNGRKYNVSKNSIYANQTFVILPTKNHGRLNALAKKLRAQDIELFTNNNSISVKTALNQSGKSLEDFMIPEGSLIIPNNQPEAPLISAILEFDADINESVLLEERQENLRDGSSIMYDTTAFNFSMMFGLPAISVPENIANNLNSWQPRPTNIEINEKAIMWATDGQDDRSVAFAARLMEKNVQVRIIDKAAVLSGHELSRGSVVVLGMDNPKNKNLIKEINAVATELDISLHSLESGFGNEELPDWGGRHFNLLERPQIAILSHSGFSSYDVGVSWWSIDHHLGIRHSQINSSFAGYADLRRYNTIIMPSGSPSMNTNNTKALMDWVAQGGTLIANNRSTRFLASNEEIGSVRMIQDTFENSNDYNFDLLREISALNNEIDKTNIQQYSLDLKIEYPWESAEERLSQEELEFRDEWQSIFMPSGAMVAGRVDNKHWLSFGVPDVLPILYGNYPVLMTGRNAEAVIRIGSYEENKEVQDYRTINWSTIPPGKDLNIRMSGLVWPEAAQRIANSAYLTRERVGKGQIILFSGEPNFRGSARGTNRLWLNAVVYGAGLGTASRIAP
ncbi:M14 family metallopeptidase [Gammaproteobacteria bacterium]|nr:M14 family metallopeptidase [Gammaproteobacteria bacterium]